MPSDAVMEATDFRGRCAALGGRDGLLFLSSSPSFLLAVALLLLNDWVLKDAVGNWLTGKLSDFAGLFAFALFWGALVPGYRRAAVGLTAVAFMVWKSPLSADLLAVWNAMGIWPLQRVVDYTDWLALSALFPAYRLLDRASPRGNRPIPARRAPMFRQRVNAVATAAVAMAAFMATSVAAPSYPIPDDAGYLVPYGRSEVRRALDSLGFYVSQFPQRRRDSAADSLMLYIRQPPERDVSVRIEVREVSPDASRIRLFEASVFGPEPKPEAIHRAFREQVIALLRGRAASSANP